MAETLISSVLEKLTESVISSVLEKLADPLITEILLLYGVRDEVEWLQAELRWMVCFLKDAEEKRRIRGNELIKNWVREVREVAHEAEDIIDTFTIEIDGKKGLLQRIVRFPGELISSHKVGTEIKGLKAKIDRIKESRERYGLVNLAQTTPSLAATDETLQARRRIYPHLNDNNTLVVGLDVHMKEIADRLLNPNIKRRSVVSIVGIGGLGKTTLANMVYNDREIKANFDVSACISVSEDYMVHKIYKELVKQMMGKTMAELQSYDVDELVQMLREFLVQRRYLILLDDVWRKDVWDQLIRAALPEVNNGSRVLLTTRLRLLATKIDPTVPPYELPFLNEDESWALFLNKAFLPYQESFTRCPQELEGIGRGLVMRCGGLPLALEVLGGILSSKPPNSVAWTSVAEQLDWASTDSTDNGGDCYKILGLSYNNLPHHHLKLCFLYLGVFPEDSVIEAQQLIELWIAEGFIPHRETQLMEDTARAYLEELAHSSMIQVVHRDGLDSSASVSTLRIHDLFRDLCIREAREFDFFNIYNTSNSTSSLQNTLKMHGKNLRRIVVHGDISTTADFAKDFMPHRNIRSILQFGTKGPVIIIPNGLKLLRVIHFAGIVNAYDEKFPKMFAKMIMNLRHLRYLRLSRNSYAEFLPSSIRNLCNLQTLDLFANIDSLPHWLGEMRTLRHLYLQSQIFGQSVSCLADVGSLTNLQTLDMMIDARGGWIERGLEKLVNIRILKVKHLAEDQVRVLIDSLRKMKYLSYLKVEPTKVIPIEFFGVLSKNTHLKYLRLCGSMSVRQLPESLHGFPPNLNTLKLSFSRLAKDPMATLEKLQYLRVLKLYFNSYKGKEMVCSSGGFPRLQELELHELEYLEEWRVEDGAMPNLTVLKISRCWSLKLPEGLQHLHSLGTLTLVGFFDDRVREDWYKIQHVPHIEY